MLYGEQSLPKDPSVFPSGGWGAGRGGGKHIFHMSLKTLMRGLVALRSLNSLCALVSRVQSHWFGTS